MATDTDTKNENCFKLSIEPKGEIYTKIVDEVFATYGDKKEKIDEIANKLQDKDVKVTNMGEDKTTLINRLLSELTQKPLKVVVKEKEKEDHYDKKDYYLYRHGIGFRGRYDGKTRPITDFSSDMSGRNSIKTEDIDELEKGCIKLFPSGRSAMKRQKIKLAFKLIRSANTETKLKLPREIRFDFKERSIVLPDKDEDSRGDRQIKDGITEETVNCMIIDGNEVIFYNKIIEINSDGNEEEALVQKTRIRVGSERYYRAEKEENIMVIYQLEDLILEGLRKKGEIIDEIFEKANEEYKKYVEETAPYLILEEI